MENHDLGFEPYERKNHSYFEGASEGEFFREIEKINILYALMEKRVQFAKLLRNNVIDKVFPLHNMEARKPLEVEWASLKKFWRPQPLDMIRYLAVDRLLMFRNYFGEEIALYYAWLGYYVTALMFSSLPGVITFILQYGSSLALLILTQDDQHQEQQNGWRLGPSGVQYLLGAVGNCLLGEVEEIQQCSYLSVGNSRL